jgi:predicted MFS family arabinose efflux permease
VGGVVYDASGYRSTFAVSAAVLGTSALVAAAAARRLETRPTPQETTP